MRAAQAAWNFGAALSVWPFPIVMTMAAPMLVWGSM